MGNFLMKAHKKKNPALFSLFFEHYFQVGRGHQKHQQFLSQAREETKLITFRVPLASSPQYPRYVQSKRISFQQQERDLVINLPYDSSGAQRMEAKWTHCVRRTSVCNWARAFQYEATAWMIKSSGTSRDQILNTSLATACPAEEIMARRSLDEKSALNFSILSPEGLLLKNISVKELDKARRVDSRPFKSAFSFPAY